MLCPRGCKKDRSREKGVCGCGDRIRLAKYMVHYGEEPCISGKNGSGAVFFSQPNILARLRVQAIILFIKGDRTEVRAPAAGSARCQYSKASSE